MINNDLISRDALKAKCIRCSSEWCSKESRYCKTCSSAIVTREMIDNAPTVETSKIEHKAYNEGFKDGVEQGIRLSESPAGRCKSCKYYHPYYEQLTNIPRGDGYCVIARMTPEGMTTINCNDEFGCSDYEKGGAE